MMSHHHITLLLFLLALFPACTATGKGPVGLHVINNDYALVADSNFNSLLIIDTACGGVVARRLFLKDHNSTSAAVIEDGDKGDDTDNKKRLLSSSSKKNKTKHFEWPFSLTGVTSCDTCRSARKTAGRL